MAQYPNKQKRCRSHGLTLVEVMMATVLVGGLLVAVLNLSSGVYQNYATAQAQQQGSLLADSLLREIMQTHYEDPDGSPVMGRESDEDPTTRQAFDDVDDFHGWTASPPTLRDGTALSDYGGWTRTVNVVYINPISLQVVSGETTELKQITVTATSRHGIATTNTALRSAAGSLAWQPPIEQTYIKGVTLQYQLDGQPTTQTQHISVRNHASDG